MASSKGPHGVDDYHAGGGPSHGGVPASAPELLDRPTSPEPAAQVQGWQPPLFDGPLSRDKLISLTRGGLNSVAPDVGFDPIEFKRRFSVDFLADLVRRRAARFGEVGRDTDIPFEDAQAAVRWILDDWDANPEKWSTSDGRIEKAQRGRDNSAASRSESKEYLASLAKELWATGRYTQAEVGALLASSRRGKYRGKPLTSRQVRNYLAMPATESPDRIPLPSETEPAREAPPASPIAPRPARPEDPTAPPAPRLNCRSKLAPLLAGSGRGGPDRLRPHRLTSHQAALLLNASLQAHPPNWS